MKKVIIDGVEYRAVTPEVKEYPRLEGYVNRGLFRYFKKGEMQEISSREYDTRMIEIRDSEIIVSEDKAGEVLSKFVDSCWLDECMVALGFKKDGV